MRRLVTLTLAFLPFLALAGPAHAEPGDPPPTADAKARQRDASIDRGFLTPHAESIPEGQWAVSDYELLGLGATYGVTDQLDVSLTTIIPVLGAPFAVSLQPKFVFFRGSRLVASARLQGWWGTDLDSHDSYAGGIAGVMADYYFDEGGRFAIHAGLSAGITSGALNTGVSGIADGAIFTLDLGTSLGVTDFMKVIVEGKVFGAETGDGFQIAPVGVVSYGLRFHGKHFAADIAMVRPFGSAIGEGVWAPGYPFLGFTVRP